MTSYKICCLGDGGVGKTALTVRLCSNHFPEEYDPTLCDYGKTQVVIDDQTCMLDILDTAGQEEFAALVIEWMRECEGFIIVYSITSSHSFQQVKIFKQQVVHAKGDDNSPVIIVGNKCDLKDEREVATEEGTDLAQTLGCQFKEASAKSGLNVEDSFFDIVRTIRRRTDDDENSKEISPTKNKGQIEGEMKTKSGCILL